MAQPAKELVVYRKGGNDFENSGDDLSSDVVIVPTATLGQVARAIDIVQHKGHMLNTLSTCTWAGNVQYDATLWSKKSGFAVDEDMIFADAVIQIQRGNVFPAQAVGKYVLIASYDP